MFLKILLLPLAMLWIRTLRISSSQKIKPCIIAHWHRDLLVALATFANLKIVVMVSQSDDGELFAKACTSLGYTVVRGSSRRGGADALRKLLHIHQQNPNTIFGMALDGPKGPALKAKLGTSWLAQNTGLPIYRPIFSMRTFFHTNSWDRMRIPLPFTRVEAKLVPWNPLSNESYRKQSTD